MARVFLRRGLTAAALIALAATAVACNRNRTGDTMPPRATTTTRQSPSIDAGTDSPAVEDPVTTHSRRGRVRVAVWGSPDPVAPTLGGAAVRALVLPQLFFAKPDGRWGPLLVAPGSDKTAPDATSATFAIRSGSAWSDGSPVTVDDLRRTADARFVASIDGPGARGSITVHFTQALPGWRRLWSGVDAITAPRPGVWGGPFMVKAVDPGLQTVLVPNPGWRGQGPFLDELDLVLVPDPTTARQLLQRDEVDVVGPPAETHRTAKLEAVDGVSVHSTIADGGWWVGLFLNPDKLGQADRAAVVASVDRASFTSALLDAEAVRLDGFGGAQDATWSSVAPGDTSALKGDAVDLAGELEEPMTPLLNRSMQKRARSGGGRLELRAAEADRVEPWLAGGDYQAAIAMAYDGPQICWRCRWERVDAGLAQAADTGDLGAAGALEAKLAGESILVPLWRPRTVVAWRTGAVSPLRANPYGLSPAWDAWRWTSG